MRMLAKLGSLEDFVKAALVDEAQHLRGLAGDEARALELARLRNIPVPMKDVALSMEGGIPIYESRPDVANLRLGSRDIGAARTPNAPMPTVSGPSPLQEGEFLKGQYAKTNLQRAKHHWLGPVKRFMGSPTGKLVGKGLGIGALGAAGLGLYSYMKNRKVPQPEEYQLSPQEQAMFQSQMYGMQPKMGAAGNPAVTVPRPAPVPRITPSGPAVANLPQKQRDATAIGAGTGAMPKTPGQDSMLQAKQADLDPSIAALLAGGLGGAGGFMAGKHLIAPMLERQEKNIAEEILKKQQSVDILKKLRGATPIGMAALGAVTLAAVAAAKARADERQKVDLQHVLAGRLHPYDPTGAGFGAADNVAFGSPYEKVYG